MPPKRRIRIKGHPPPEYPVKLQSIAEPQKPWEREPWAKTVVADPHPTPIRLDLSGGFVIIEQLLTADAGSYNRLEVTIGPRDPELWNTLVRHIATPTNRREQSIVMVHHGHDWYIRTAEHFVETETIPYENLAGAGNGVVTRRTERIAMTLIE